MYHRFLIFLIASLQLTESGVPQEFNHHSAVFSYGSTPLTDTEHGSLTHNAPLSAPKSDPQVSKRVEFAGRNIAGFVMAAFFIMIAAGGGIGGGGVLVPTFIFVFGFAPKVAIPLSNITILGSSLTNVLLNYSKRHPTADRPLIDWDIMLVMEPVTIAGAVIGSFVNVLSPPWLLCILLVTLLSLTTISTMKKGIKKFKKESAQRLNNMEVYEQMLETGQSIVEEPVSELQSPRFRAACDDLNTDLMELLKTESVHSEPKVLAMFWVTVGVLVLEIIKGGHGVNPLGLECGSWQYWVVSVAVLPFVLLVSYLARNHLVERYHRKARIGYQYVDGDVQWNELNTIKYPLICSIAGLCAGLFGIGGGIVKGPLMLEMGVRPEVSSATSATMILFTSSAATVSYLLFNALNVHFALILFPLGFVCTLIGQKVLNYFVKKYNRSSLIVLVIGFVVGASAIAMGAESGGSLVRLFQGRADHPRPMCHA